MVDKIASNQELGDYVPAYMKILRDLERRIDAGEFPPNTPIFSERKICQKYKVSRITARRTLEELVSRGRIYRIQGKGSFVNRTSALPEAARRIALIVNGMYDQGTLPIILKGIENEAHENGFQLTFFNCECRFEKYKEVSDLILKSEFDGVILDLIQSDEDYDRNREIIDRLEAGQIPVVLVQKYIFSHPDRCSYVISDNYRGACEMMEHLIRIGHSRIAFIHDVFCSSTHNRLQGYYGGLIENNLEIDHNLVREIKVITDLGAVLDDFLGMGMDRPTAIFCVNDLMAIETLSLLKERGVSVPEEMAIVGFDDLPLASLLAVPLTTVSQQIERIGSYAVRVLINRARNKASDPAIHFILPCQVIVRQSCGASIGAYDKKEEGGLP